MQVPPFPIAVRFLPAIAVFLAPAGLLAHVSERALVLLLPTDIYIPAGVSVVAASAVILAIIPPAWLQSIERPMQIVATRRIPRVDLASCLSQFAVFALIAIGWFGPRDPLGNLLTLTFWTLFFVGFPFVQSLFGDLWRWLNPWTGLYRLIIDGAPAPLKLPEIVGQWPAVLVWLFFTGFLLADPAPDDPARLAILLLGYWLSIFAGMLLFGEDWFERAEAFTLWLRLFAALAPVQRQRDHWVLRFPGASLIHSQPRSVAGIVFVIVVLGAGSFDGLNETFWWLALIDVNPLEFPGRSAVINETLFGLVAAIVVLAIVFLGCVALGQILVGQIDQFAEASGRLVLSLVPIAIGYHFAHYLTVMLVNGQYALAALSDPLANGSDLLGLGTYYVTTSFFNVSDTVRIIWLAQAGAIVIGHVVGVFIAHSIALDMNTNYYRATISQIPLAVLMVFYTLFGLWLLASPTA